MCEYLDSLLAIAKTYLVAMVRAPSQQLSIEMFSNLRRSERALLNKHLLGDIDFKVSCDEHIVSTTGHSFYSLRDNVY